MTVTGSKPGYPSVSRNSAWVGGVTYGPTALADPTIAGTPQVGSTLTAVTSSTTPGAEFTYTWFADGTPILGETNRTLVLQTAQLRTKVTVRVRAWAPDYSAVSKLSGETEAVAPVPGDSVTRLAGDDRYATSAAISASQFQPGVPVAYIASGLNFPDALSGAPLAGLAGGPRPA